MIDYAKELNPAQYEAVTTLDGPVLVIAGAGSGKTRTIVYRLAHMVEQGIPPSCILLLTFTRKASHEMQVRAGQLLGMAGMGGVQGGTFHGFAYSVLRQHRPAWYGERELSVMDGADALSAIQHCKESLGVGKGDRSFPKTQTIVGLLSKARNKELEVEEVIRREAYHLLVHAESIARIGDAYKAFRREHGLLDYDDLLFELDAMLTDRPDLTAYLRERHRYLMVDEFQDTNLVQARIVRHLAGQGGNVMAVGDDAQSIYAFRGADIRNILSFPEMFPGAKVIKLEENYRSTQPVLDLTNAILDEAPESFKKRLFTSRTDGAMPRVVRPLSDLTQASLAVSRVSELLRTYPAHEVAILFRAGYQSYHVEVQLNKLGVKFRKYGGLRYSEAAHIKDVVAYARLLVNPLDLPAFQRIAALSRGVGPKTTLRLYEIARQGDPLATARACAKYPELAADLELLDTMRRRQPSPQSLLEEVVEHYRPRLEANHPDDWPRRVQGLEQLTQIASAYRELDLFVADLSLEDPGQEEENRDAVVLSTIHSAKGLEWSAVIIIDLVEERFPSRHAIARAEDFEEERRLMYVACTRAREQLDLFMPASLYQRGDGGNQPAIPSPFVRDLPARLYEEWYESYTGGLLRREARPAPVFGKAMSRPPVQGAGSMGNGAGGGARPMPLAPPATYDSPMAPPPVSEGAQKCGFCHHKIFGRGKIVQHLPPDKCRVNFPGFGLKVILTAFLTLED